MLEKVVFSTVTFQPDSKGAIRQNKKKNLDINYSITTHRGRSWKETNKQQNKTKRKDPSPKVPRRPRFSMKKKDEKNMNN